jgi:HEPN domain-containing protein
MPHDARTTETVAWLAKADQDPGAARMLLDGYPDVALFHCQQAVEKALKAFLVWHDVPFRKSHDLREIGQQCVRIEPTLDALARSAAPLAIFAWRTRYPDEEIEPPPRDEVLAILATAEHTVAELKRLLPT